MKYIILEGIAQGIHNAKQNLQEQVNEKFKEGYQPLGGVQIVYSCDLTRYFQSMVNLNK